ncbi:MAG TPA: Gfo/Idh/MocA family oxidoreductase [Pirellulales bacterium]|nr:Gfo/Idh/MocA family oxidoreductase [Pirellulales bacterium]
MNNSRLNRRQFVQTSAGLMALASHPCWMTRRAQAADSPNERPLVGAIGLGGQGTSDAKRAAKHGTVVALCDVHRQHAERAKEKHFQKAEIFGDYRRLLDRQDIEAVTIGTPDHWHTEIALAALEAGKHVYCEKPLTLTIDEGKQLVAAVKKSGKVMQVGTQQRGDQYQLFGRAVATVRSGQLGKLTKVTVNLPLSTEQGGPFPAQPTPEGLDWDFWLGQAPGVDYCPERCHFRFRWWYEYSGGIATDWGAHHMDVAHWAMDLENSGPITIDGSTTPLPGIAGGFNTPKLVTVNYLYPDDIQVQMLAQPPGDEGILFEGENGRIYVNRGRITGKAIEDQDADESLKNSTMEAVEKLFKGNTAQMGDHMGNFFEAWKFGKWPISDVESQHRSVSACHLANISIRLQRKLNWDAAQQVFVDDSQANSMLQREQREPYQIRALT